jgi:hypothetical protein
VSGNPFTYGNPISDPRRFFGREREVEQIFSRLRNSEFESSSLVGDRRIGKTSLLNYLAVPEVRAAHGFEPARYVFIFVDLQMVDESMRPGQLWRHLLALLRRNCAGTGIDRLAARIADVERLDLLALDELFQQVDDSGKNVVFLLDEFERVTSNENFGPDFYYGLRSLMIHHRLALVTASRRELIELCRDEAIRSSPFFNVFANIGLRPFTSPEARHMISSLLAGTGIGFTADDLARVFDLAGCHPFFLQALCWMMFEARGAGAPAADGWMSLAERFRSEATPHFLSCWDSSPDYEKITLTAAALLEHRVSGGRVFTLTGLQELFARCGPAVERLERRGLLAADAGEYRLFSSLLGPWILDQLAAGLAEEQDYPAWLAENKGAVDRAAGRRSGRLREVLPKVSPRYRRLIVTWASDPKTVTAMADLLNNVLGMLSGRG